MNLATTIWIYGGGPGSGCTGPNCGRPTSFVKNTRVFDMPPPPQARGFDAMHHYVVDSEGMSQKVDSHMKYFSNGSGDEDVAMNNLVSFLKKGGITVTVTAGGPGIMFGKKDMDVVDKVLQVAAHPEYREYGASVEYMNPSTGERVSFDGSVGKLSRELRTWVSQKKVA